MGPAFARTIADSGGVRAQACDDTKRVAVLAMLLLPLRRLSVPLKKAKTQSLAQHISREALKWRAKDGDAVTLLHSEAEELARMHAQGGGAGESLEAEGLGRPRCGGTRQAVAACALTSPP